jgi:hypothetical protein
VDVAQAVVCPLGVRNAVNIESRPTVRRDAFERLTDALADRAAVLILDNCEHLVDAAADLADRLLARSAAAHPRHQPRTVGHHRRGAVRRPSVAS